MIRNIRIQFLMGLLMVDLIKNIPKLEFYLEQGYDETLLLKILKYIENSYDSASLKELSVKLNYPNYKLSKFLKETTGKTFQELLLEKRFDKVEELLKNTDYSIAEIIREVGYENTTYFYKIFNERYKMSPKDYKEFIKK